MKPRRSTAGLALVLLGAVPVAASAAELRLPHLLSDHMVVQAGRPVPVWGWAEPGEPVTVRFGGQTQRAITGPDGRFELRLGPMGASSVPSEMVVASVAERVIHDVLVGEVWLCSGQSNMEKPIGEQAGQKPVWNAEAEIASADFSQIRLFKVKRARSSTPLADVEGEWVRCSPDSIDRIKFSAAGYFFGRKLHQELKVPVGLLDSTWGGTRIEVWTPAAAFERLPALADVAAVARQAGAKFEGVEPASLYNGMIHPLAPFALRGAIWYQGESNVMDVEDGPRYADEMTALVNGWRDLWKTTLSFYYVQIAPYLYHVARPGRVGSPEATPLLWEAQTASMRLPMTGMVVTTDLVDDLFDIHPRNKLDVGLRLARWALAKDYGRAEIEVSGPTYREMDVKDGKAVLHFDHTSGGLVIGGGETLRWFVVAGRDGRFYPAQAIIEGDTAVVSSPKVAEPAVVRFAWDEAAQPNLFNKAGLPAVPFRTDSALVRSRATSRR